MKIMEKDHLTKTDKLEDIFRLKDEVSIFVKEDYHYYRLHPDKKSDYLGLTGKEALQKCGKYGDIKVRAKDGKTIEGRIERVYYEGYESHIESTHISKQGISIPIEEFVQNGRPFEIKRILTLAYRPIIEK